MSFNIGKWRDSREMEGTENRREENEKKRRRVRDVPSGDRRRGSLFLDSHACLVTVRIVTYIGLRTYIYLIKKFQENFSLL